MTLDDARELFEYWKGYPPLRDLVAAFVGFKPAGSESEPKHLNRDEFTRMIQQTGGRIPGVPSR